MRFVLSSDCKMVEWKNQAWKPNEIPKPWVNPVSPGWENEAELLRYWCRFNESKLRWEPPLYYWCTYSDWKGWEPPWGFCDDLRGWARWKNSRAIVYHVKNTFRSIAWNDIVSIILEYTHGDTNHE